MKNLKYVWILIIILTLGSLITGFISSSHPSEQPISEFIIGKWQANFQESDDKGAYQVQYQIEFVRPNLLIVNIESPRFRKYNIVSHYKLIDGNQIEVQGRLIDRWIIKREGYNLIISSAHDALISSGNYRRILAIQWPVLAVFLGVLTVGLFTTLKEKRQQSMIVRERQGYLGQKHWTPTYILQRVLILMIFSAGMFVGRAFWALPIFLSIRIPWDAVIMVETCIAILLIATGAFSTYHAKHDLHASLAVTLWYYLGIFLAGISSWGIVVGLLKFGIFAVFGSYLPE